MISINRIACPAHLDTSQRNLVKADYQNASVVTALLTMQHFKCCYCEKDLTLLGRSALWVEHFIAKTDNSFKNADGNTNWNRANTWTNLLYACSTCNRSKGTDKPFDNKGNRRLIDPSYAPIDPEAYIGFYINGLAISYKAIKNKSLGKNTITNLKLKDRKDVYACLRRCKIEIDAVFSDYVNAVIDGNINVANVKLSELSIKTSAYQPHASFCRKYIKLKQDRYNNQDIPIINQHQGTQLAPIAINIASRSQVIP